MGNTRIVIIIAVILALALLAGCSAFEKDNNTKPNDTDSIEMLDGDRTMMANPVLLEIISGTWESETENYALTIDNEQAISFFQNGELLWSDVIDFVYLVPSPYSKTDFSLAFGGTELKPGYKILSFCHLADEGFGKIHITASD